MNIHEAKAQLFDTNVLLAEMRRRDALSWLMTSGGEDAVAILVDAVERGHQDSTQIKAWLAGLSSPEHVRALLKVWITQNLAWLKPLAVERVLASGLAAELPVDRDTAWLVAKYQKSPLAPAVNIYRDCVLAAKPDFMVAFVLKIGQALSLECSRLNASAAMALIRDQDAEVRAGAEAYLRDRLPNAEQYNDLIVDEWIRSQSPFLAKLVATPRLPSNPAKEALIHLINRDLAGYRKLTDKDGTLLAEALALATPEMRKAINQTILEARDGGLADAYRQAAAAGSPDADPQIALRALMASGNEDGLVEATRAMTLAEVLPLCDHWRETRHRPTSEKYRAIVERAVAALSHMPKLEIEPAPALPDGLEDLFDVWQRENPSDAQVNQDLSAEDPFVRAKALFIGSERGLVDAAALRAKATSADWPERLMAALRGARPAEAGEDHVAWITTVAGLDADLMGARIACDPEELQWSNGLCRQLRSAKGPVAARNLALAETLSAFRSLYGGTIKVSEDDSATQKEAIRVGGEVEAENLKF